MRFRCERGQVTVVAAVGLVVVALLMMLLVALGQRAADQAQAQTAADAAALAAAQFDSTVGHRVAGANGGVATFEVDAESGMVRADAVVNGRQAAAQAQPGAVALQGLAPVMVAAIARAGQMMGTEVVVVSGWRSREEQERLWAFRSSNPYPVAPPGTSMHERGLAIDVPVDQVEALAAVAAEVGLKQPLPEADPIHFVWAGAAPGS